MKCVFLPVILAAYLALLVGNVTGLQVEKIINGVNAIKGQFPYSVFYRAGYSNATGHMCGGALIAPNIVLTAAHCIYNLNKNEFKDLPFVVVAGTTDIHVTGESIAVSKMYSHKEYDELLHNDIAVLRLEKSFNINDLSPIKIISLPKKNESFVSKYAAAIGFGYDKINEDIDPEAEEKGLIGTSEEKLKFANVQVMDHNNCDVSPDQLCVNPMRSGAKHLFTTTCFGDSGGPLVYGNKVIGIVSHGRAKNCYEEEPTFFAKVSHFIDFIQGAMDDRPTDDTLVKSIEGYRHFEIPTLNLDMTTRSPHLIAALEYLKVHHPIYISGQALSEDFITSVRNAYDEMFSLSLVEPYW